MIRFTFSLVFLIVLSQKFCFAQFASPDTTICPYQQVSLYATGSTFAQDTIAFTDDVYSDKINIGFPFTFYGNTYDSLLIGSNVILSFDLANAGLFCPFTISQPIPNLVPFLSNTIMGPHHDIHPGIGGVISYGILGQSPNRIFFVDFCEVPMFSCIATVFTGQIQLFEGTNIIETHIAEKDTCSAWNSGRAIHGLNNEDGTVADTVPGRNFPTKWATQNEGYRFTPNGIGSYLENSIPFQPITLGPSISWYDIGGNFLATGDTLWVNPSTTTEYVAEAFVCATNNSVYDTVVVSTNCTQGCFAPYAAVVSQNLCYNACLAAVEIAPVGAFSPWTVQVFDSLNNSVASWVTLGGVDTLSGLCSGTYTVETTDSSGCIQSEIFTVSDPSVLQSQTTAQAIKCADICDGTFTITASGGTSPYMYSLDSGQTFTSNPNFWNKCPGLFTILVKDANGCEVMDSTVIDSATASPLLLQSITQAVTCEGSCDGSITLLPSGGTPPYLYAINFLWMGQNSPNFDSLCEGTYNLFLRDSLDCVAYDTNVVGQAPGFSILSANILPVTFGNNGSIGLMLSGGIPPFDFSWSNGDSTAQIGGLAAGTYWVNINDSNGCFLTDTFEVESVTNLPKMEITDGIKIFPNPASDKITIGFPALQSLSGVKITAVSTTGQLIFQRALNPKNGEVLIQTHTWPTGSYDLRIEMDEGEQWTEKVLIAR